MKNGLVIVKGMRSFAQLRNLGSYATKLFHSSAIPSAGRVVPRSSSVLVRSPPPFTSLPEVFTWVTFSAGFYAFFEWNHFHGSNLYHSWKAKSELQNMLVELDRKKKESPEAYLDMIKREFASLKELNAKRNKEKLAEWEVKSYERKVAVLDSKLHE